MKIRSIIKENFGEKDWVKVKFNNGEIWIPALPELAEILHKIGECENEKYPFGKGEMMVVEYIADAILGKPIEELNKEYKFPNK